MFRYVIGHENRPSGSGRSSLGPRQTPSVAHEIPLERISSTPLRAAVDIWRAQVKGRAYPARSELPPRHLAPFLRNVCLLRLCGDDGEFEYRVTGDATVEAWGQSFTGLNTAALNAIEEGAGDSVRALCQIVLERRAPVAIRGRLSRRHTYVVEEGVYLPLGPDAATIDSILSVSCFILM